MVRRQAQNREAKANINNGGESDEHDDGVAALQQLADEVKISPANTDEGNRTADELDGDLARWQQHILECPRDGLRSLEIMFTTSAYDYLTILSLPHNAIDDISPIAYTAKTLRLLNLNGNAISQLPSPSDAFWSKFQSLTLLFLSGNSLATWQSVEGLVQSPKLLWLTLDGNPLMSRVHAREFLLNKLPLSLKALNDHVVTDVEYIKHASHTVRFGAQNFRLFISDALRVPSNFDENEAVALAYVASTEATIRTTYACNSPTVITQRTVRGYLSRHYQLPLFTRIRRLVVRVQSTIRGYLFRRTIRIELAQLVTRQGQQELLVGPMDDALFMTGGASRGLRKLVALVRQWRAHYRVKKQAIAIKKIRFWCQLVYQRYRYRSQQLLQDQQEIFIYYTAAFEDELLEMALKTAHRDPILMTMTPEERETLVRQRCVPSGVSVLRPPSQSRAVVVASPTSLPPSSSRQSTPLRIKRENAMMGKLRKTVTPPLVRIFRKDQCLETHVLVTEKQLIQHDLALLKRLSQQNQVDSKRASPLLGSQRAVLVQTTQLSYELERRLVIVNRKILAACLKLQQQRTNRRLSFSLSHVAIRVRGHAPTRPERRKLNRLLSSPATKPTRRSPISSSESHRPRATDYTRMRVFVPWSIDMYMQIIASLDRMLLLTTVSVGFAVSYEQTRHVHAAVTIQSAWRAARCHCKRDTLEVTLLRAAVCLQRWWRYHHGLGRRMAFVRACLLTCGAVNSATLYMEASVYQLLADASRWHTTVRPAMRSCKEHALHCLMVDGVVEISLSPSQMMLYSASTTSSSSYLWSAGDPGKVDAASTQRCGAYLPVWLSPGTPEHFEESMVSRDADATSHLLMDHVHVEPTLIERELLLVGSTRTSVSSSSGELDNPYARFAVCREVRSVGARVMDLARKFSIEHRKAAPPTTVATATSFVRLTFDSAEEARHRALVLVAKTFDPITHSYARLFSLEALVGASMLRHQWAVAQAIGDPHDGDAFLRDCKLWLQAELPSPWAKRMQTLVPLDANVSEEMATKVVHSSARPTVLVPHRPTPPTLVAPSSLARTTDSPAALHITESFIDKGIQPVCPPTRPSVSSPSPSLTSFSRHQQLTDRLGKPAYQTLDDMRQVQARDRDLLVRDLREERERAAEAIIVDKRMIQREHAAELAGIHLDMRVKLQKLKYEQELTKLHTREFVEREKLNENARKLTRQVETSFVAQTGAMMRRAARRAVETELIKKEAIRNAKAVKIHDRDEDALGRRQDAKSYCFVSNQKTKQTVDATSEAELAARATKEKHRQMHVRQRIREDKEIKKMLRLM